MSQNFSFEVDEVDIPVEAIRKASYEDGYQLGLDYSKEIGMELGFYEYVANNFKPQQKAMQKLVKLLKEFTDKNDIEKDYNLIMSRIRSQYKLIKKLHNAPPYNSTKSGSIQF
eukprot:NODE_16_length_41655_cov_0.272813.p25 type:complete len:113 gc:universal NODE_16_length_41655_cov_0.272813:37507-37169(-)